MIQHSMYLHGGPFMAIEEDKKTIEARLFDEKRRAIKLGDEIIFANRDSDETLCTEVTGLLHFPTFEQLFDHVPAERFGKASTEQLMQQIRQFFSPEDEQKYGVLGIVLKRKPKS